MPCTLDIRYSRMDINKLICRLRLPLEVVDHIVVCILQTSSKSPSFSVISSFSLTCFQFREIAFRRFFSMLDITRKTGWLTMCSIPGMADWVRWVPPSACFDDCKMRLSIFNAHICNFAGPYAHRRRLYVLVWATCDISPVWTLFVSTSPPKVATLTTPAPA